MSKHAIEAFTDTLASEMAPHNVKVSVVEPGTYKTQIAKNTFNRAIEIHKNNRDTDLAEWQKELFAKGPGLHDSYPPPDKVASAVADALFEKTPKRRYLAVPEKEQAVSTVNAALKRAVQLNDGSEYAMDRTALIKMLEDEISRQEKARLKK